RHIERDKMSAPDAAVSGTMEIVSAVVASTWTVMVVFIPLFLIKGQAGQMFTQFALVVIFALAVSLLDATTVVPMLATRLISGEAHQEQISGADPSRHWLLRAFTRFGHWFDALDAFYRRQLEWALQHRWLTIGGALAITLASALLIPRIGTELLPQTDSGDFTVSIKLPPGTALAKTDEVMRQVEDIVSADPSVDTVFTTVGAGAVRGPTTTSVPFQGSVTARLKDKRTRTTQQVITALRPQLARLPGIRASLAQFDLVTLLLSGGNQNVEVDIFGDDLGVLSSSASQVMARARTVPGLENIDINWQEAMPEVQWGVDRVKAAQLGVSFADIANTINTATNGTIATYYQEKGFQYPVVVQLTPGSRKTVAEMAEIMVAPSSPATPGRAVILSQVAYPVYGLGPSEITRQNRQRYIAVTGTPQGRSSGEVQQDIQRALADLRLPTGYYWAWGTNQQRTAEEFSGLGLAVLLAISLIYMLLASQFESFLHPLTILLSVPLAVTGVILALFLTGRSFGLTAFIGVLMLVGIVSKNGILLVDYTNTLRKRGIERDEAVLTAAPTRLRPILMTASAAILGMLPLAIGLGKGSEIQAPMATAVIGGLFTSTLLTLLIVPTVYTLFDDLSGLFRRKNRPLRGQYNG
ncbi:MAG TPA: efflux RND transporter permease subunit, partial [Armatimonadota bacterium]